MDWITLDSEIKNDPLKRNYKAKSNQQVADDLNTKYRESKRPISSKELLAWSGMNRRLNAIENAQEDLNISADGRNIAKVAYLLITRTDTELDLSLPDRQAMLDILVSDGVLTTPERAELYDMATIQISRAQELQLPRIKASDVARVRSW